MDPKFGKASCVHTPGLHCSVKRCRGDLLHMQDIRHIPSCDRSAAELFAMTYESLSVCVLRPAEDLRQPDHAIADCLRCFRPERNISYICMMLYSGCR